MSALAFATALAIGTAGASAATAATATATSDVPPRSGVPPKPVAIGTPTPSTSSEEKPWYRHPAWTVTSIVLSAGATFGVGTSVARIDGAPWWLTGSEAVAGQTAAAAAVGLALAAGIGIQSLKDH